MKYDDYCDFDAYPNTVVELFTNREWFERKYQNLTASDVEVMACNDDGEHFGITVHLFEPASDSLPTVIRKLTGDWVGMTRNDTWKRSDNEGRVIVDIDKNPITIDVRMQLKPLESGSRLHMHFDVEARLPVIAARVERFMIDDIVGRIRDDMAESQRLLAEYLVV